MRDIADRLPPLGSGTVHIIQFSEKVSPAIRSELLGFLTREDEEEFQSCIQSRERDRRQLFRALSRAVLSSYCSCSPVSLRFIYNSHGKPSIDPDTCRRPLQFNLSHAGPRGVMAVAEGFSVGIDLERISRRSHLQEIASRFFTPEEQNYYHAEGDRDEQLHRFYSLWTRKEAVVKAMGESLPRWLAEISVLPSDRAESWERVGTPALPDGVLLSYDAGSEYAGALCAEILPDRLETISLDTPGSLLQEGRPDFR